MTIIAIDPHITKNYAYSIWDNGELQDVGKFSSMKEFQMMLEIEEPTKVLIEDQYLSKNFNTAKNLTLNTGKVFGICELYDVNCISVNVATWKSKIPGLNKYDKDKSLTKYRRNKMKQKLLIEKAEEVISQFWTDIIDVDDDIASAVLIAYTMEVI